MTRRSANRLAAENPFSAKHIRPGAIDFLFDDGASAAAIVEQFWQHDQRGEIIGPHGSGKSTLLCALAVAFAEVGVVPVEFRLHDGQRRLPVDWRETVANRSRTDQRAVVVIDGYEQLSWWSRRQIDSHCRRQNLGLLITAHQRQGLPTLFTTRPTAELLLELVHQRLTGNEISLSDEEVLQAWHDCQGDLRETFFTLYDVYERQRRC